MFLHTDPDDRPAEVYDGGTLSSGDQRQSYLLLPFVPSH
jgi:hypothetical protein